KTKLMANLQDNILYTSATTAATQAGVTVTLRRNFAEATFTFSSTSPDISFSPPSAIDIVIESVVVIDITGYTAGVYSFDCEAIGGGEQHQFTVELTMIESDDPEIPVIPVIIPPVPKYVVEYKNISGDDVKLEIWKY